MIFESPQSDLFRFKFNLLSSKILKIPEFNLSILNKHRFEIFSKRWGPLWVISKSSMWSPGRRNLSRFQWRESLHERVDHWSKTLARLVWSSKSRNEKLQLGNVHYWTRLWRKSLKNSSSGIREVQVGPSDRAFCLAKSARHIKILIFMPEKVNLMHIVTESELVMMAKSLKSGSSSVMITRMVNWTKTSRKFSSKLFMIMFILVQIPKISKE